jgi:ribosomal protein S27AE
MPEENLFTARGKKCPKCGSETVFRDTAATFCGDCGYVIEQVGIADAMIDEDLKLEAGKIYSAEELEEMVKQRYSDFFLFMNTLLSSDRMQPHFKVLPKGER